MLWEIERRQSARKTQERRQANIAAQHDLSRQEVEDGPPVFVLGRPLQERELADFDARVRWLIQQHSGGGKSGAPDVIDRPE